jgi:hypothetical protein
MHPMGEGWRLWWCSGDGRPASASAWWVASSWQAELGSYRPPTASRAAAFITWDLVPVNFPAAEGCYCYCSCRCGCCCYFSCYSIAITVSVVALAVETGATGFAAATIAFASDICFCCCSFSGCFGLAYAGVYPLGLRCNLRFSAHAVTLRLSRSSALAGWIVIHGSMLPMLNG